VTCSAVCSTSTGELHERVCAPFKVRQVTGWLTRHPTTLSEDDTLQPKAILEQCPELLAAAGHVRAFGEMLTQLTGQGLPG
jgi:hypothetical protein